MAGWLRTQRKDTEIQDCHCIKLVLPMTKAVYPGSFDPVHNGHVDIAVRASKLFGSLIVAVYDAPPKVLKFTTEERVEFFSRSVRSIKNISVIPQGVACSHKDLLAYLNFVNCIHLYSVTTPMKMAWM